MSSKKEKVIVIGAGFAGLTSAALLAHEGYQVKVVEKNPEPGGRARDYQKDGYRFDMGPSWYLMPEIFDDFFKKLGKNREDYYQLTKLDPSYRVFFSPQERVDISPDRETNLELFEKYEPGGRKKLEKYLDLAEYKYNTAVNEFLYREYKNIFSFFNKKIIFKGLQLDIFSSLDSYVAKFFKNPKLQKILAYAMVFLGSSPQNAPALYSIMSHIDLNLGVWFPSKGMIAVIEGMVKLCEELGVTFEFNNPVTKIEVEGKEAHSVVTAKGAYPADIVVSTADLHHSETRLLEPRYQTYPEKYWKKKVLAPSMFIMYVGINKKLPQIAHHNLYFQEDWNKHFDTIFKKPSWPKDPCYYVSCTSKTDDKVAPQGGENLFFLIPVAPGLDDNDQVRAQVEEETFEHFENLIGEKIRDNIQVKRIFSHRDFISDYNALKGTALGLSHTLDQTAVFRPDHKSKKVKNLYYSGQYNHPGVGVPMTIISSVVLRDRLLKERK